LYAKVLILLILFSCLYADKDYSGLAQLSLYPGASSEGLAEAYVAKCSGSIAIGWNPAGIVNSKGTDIYFSHNSWIAGIYHDFVSASYSDAKNAYAFGLTSVHIPDIEARDGATVKPMYTFTATNLEASISYSRRVNDRLNLGINGKFIYDKIEWNESIGFAFDLGSIYSFHKRFKTGLLIRNIGPKISMGDDKVPLPAAARLGFLWELPLYVKQADFYLSSDIEQAYGQNMASSMGLEIDLLKTLALRGGFRPRRDKAYFSTGLGLHKGRFSLNYSFTPLRYDLGNSHRFDIGMGF